MNTSKAFIIALMTLAHFGISQAKRPSRRYLLGRDEKQGERVRTTIRRQDVEGARQSLDPDNRLSEFAESYVNNWKHNTGVGLEQSYDYAKLLAQEIYEDEIQRHEYHVMEDIQRQRTQQHGYINWKEKVMEHLKVKMGWHELMLDGKKQEKAYFVRLLLQHTKAKVEYVRKFADDR